jgi:hypothetical protein
MKIDLKVFLHECVQHSERVIRSMTLNKLFRVLPLLHNQIHLSVVQKRKTNQRHHDEKETDVKILEENGELCQISAIAYVREALNRGRRFCQEVLHLQGGLPEAEEPTDDAEEKQRMQPTARRLAEYRRGEVVQEV